MFDLSGKSALVTGATSGIGKAVVQTLCARGARVAGTGRRQANLAEIRDQLGDDFVPIHCDLLDKSALEPMLSSATEALGSISILVNAAGVTQDGLLLRMTEKAWDDVLAVNLTAAMILTRRAMQQMMRQRWGRIINITSVVAATGNPGQSNYVASKAGLTGLTKSVALEAASRGITVNAVAPGLIATEMTESLYDSQREQILQRIPLARAGLPHEVASAVLFLASEEAAYITGATLDINGGMAML